MNAMIWIDYDKSGTKNIHSPNEKKKCNAQQQQKAGRAEC